MGTARMQSVFRRPGKKKVAKRETGRLELRAFEEMD